MNGAIATPLLGMAPLLKEDTQDAQAYVVFMRATLNEYAKSFDDVAFIVADNCNTNGSIARICGVPLVGCYSHKFNLAIKAYMSEYEDALSSVNLLMGKLKRLNTRG